MTNQLSLHPSILRPNPWNSNIVSPDNERKLDEAIKRLGFFKPVVVREVAGVEGYEIIGGEHRWGSAKRLGLEAIPVINLGMIDDTRAKEIAVADNSRYGADDSALLAQILEDIGLDNVQDFLPFTDADTRSLFSSIDIALAELDLEETDAPEAKVDEPAQPKAPKTHTVMRFKVSLGDAEKITELIARTQKDHGFTTSDDLTNAGDALAHLLVSSPQSETAA